MVDLEARNDYYSNIEVLFEIVKNLIGRETVFLSKKECWRCLKIHKLEFFNKHARKWAFWRKPFNIYYSLARLYNMPMMTYSRYERKDQQNEFSNHFNRYVVGFDLGFDFDGHKLGKEQAYKDTKKLKMLFDSYNIAYELKCSGGGFHINVNHDKMPDITDKPDFFKRMVEKIKLIFCLQTLDLGIYDERRIWKVPYSYDVKSGNIALPLDNYQFDNFKWDMVLPKAVLRLNIRNRGNLGRAGKKENFTHFLTDYILDEVLEIG